MDQALTETRHWTVREEEQGISHQRLIGKGGFGEVHELSSPVTGKVFARKVIRELGFVTKDDVDNEIRAIKKLCQNDHPNIVQVFDYGQLNRDSTIYFIDMELCDISLASYLLGQELKDVVSWKTVREQEEVTSHAYNILQQILNGLLYIHCLNEVHRDLSPHNVLFKNGYWKIADFGLTSAGTSKKLVTTSAARGKDSYRAPELLQDNGSGYNNKSDMWSFGCITFELFTGRKAFSNDFEVWGYGANKRSPKMYFKGLDDVTKYYVYDLLEVDPEKRPSARALLKEKFQTDTAPADSPEAVRARKRRRISLNTSTELSFLLKQSLDWAASKRELDFILMLLEVDLKPIDSRQMSDIINAFRIDWNDSSAKRFQRLINSNPPSFWFPHAVVKESHDPELLSTGILASSPSSDGSWTMLCRRGHGWHAIHSGAIHNLSKIQTLHIRAGGYSFGSCITQFSTDGRYLATYLHDAHSDVYKLSMSDDSITYHYAGSLNTKTANFCFTHDCSRLAVNEIGSASHISIWDLATYDKILQLSRTRGSVWTFDISGDDTRLVGLGSEGITLWSLETGHVIGRYDPDSQIPVFDPVKISMDGRFVVAPAPASAKHGRCFPDALPGMCLVRVPMHAPSIVCSPTNPRHFVSASEIPTEDTYAVTLWNVSSGEETQTISVNRRDQSPEYQVSELKTFRNGRGRVSALAFSEDGRWIATGSSNGLVRIWDPMAATLVAIIETRNEISKTEICNLLTL